MWDSRRSICGWCAGTDTQDIGNHSKPSGSPRQPHIFWGFVLHKREIQSSRPGVHFGRMAQQHAGSPHRSSVSPTLPWALRRWILAPPTRPPAAGWPDLPGVIVLDQDYEVDSISPEAERWLAEWGLSDLGSPPPAIAAVVGTARARAEGSSNVAPSTRLRLPSGTWLHVRATHLSRPCRPPRTAIVLDRAAADQVAPVIARAHQLSQRETDIALLVLHGLSTNEIAARLFISAYTVQDHLKSIFEKVGVRSRRELVTEVFEPHIVAV